MSSVTSNEKTRVLWRLVGGWTPVCKMLPRSYTPCYQDSAASLGLFLGLRQQTRTRAEKHPSLSFTVQHFADSSRQHFTLSQTVACVISAHRWWWTSSKWCVQSHFPGNAVGLSGAAMAAGVADGSRTLLSGSSWQQQFAGETSTQTLRQHQSGFTGFTAKTLTLQTVWADTLAFIH